MRGKASGSDRVDWLEVSLEESGGFAGLHRGATVRRAGLSAALLLRVDRALAQLAQLANARPVREQQQQHTADAQTLVVRVRSAGGSWQASFDTADLPDPAHDLLEIGPLRPLPPS